MTEELKWVPEEAKSVVEERLKDISVESGIPYKTLIRLYLVYYIEFIRNNIRESKTHCERKAVDLHIIALHRFKCDFLLLCSSKRTSSNDDLVASFLYDVIKQQKESGACKVEKKCLAKTLGISEGYVDVPLRTYALFHGYRYENGVLTFAER